MSANWFLQIYEKCQCAVSGAFFFFFFNIHGATACFLTFMWNVICNSINAVTLQHSYHWQRLHLSTLMQQVLNVKWAYSRAAECTKTLTQSNNGAICTDWWKPSVRSGGEGGAEEERVACFTSGFVTVGSGPARCRSGPTLQWQSLCLWWPERVCVLCLKVSRY